MFPLGSVGLRTEYDIWDRPHYAYGIYSAANLATTLGLSSVSVIEFGVAGGNGLRAMEEIAERVSKYFGLEIAVYGFDTGTGMPAPIDYRDLPHVWRAGFYQIEIATLRSQLRNASLILGDVFSTTREFLAIETLAPIGFVSFDLDYYSSTKHAFQIFSGAVPTRLPRVWCYFDDIIYPERACHNQYIGELCAIREFNHEHDLQKIAKP